MSDKDQRVLDGIKVTGDANLAGQLHALKTMRTLLRAHMAEQDAIVGNDERSVSRMLARGACEEIDRLLDAVEQQIAVAQSERDAWP